MIMLSIKESINVVIRFLMIYYDETSSKDVLAIINGLSNIHKTGSEQAINWEKYLDAAKMKLIEGGLFPSTETNGDKTITEEQAFEAMIDLLVEIYERTNSDDLGSFLGDLLHGDYGSTSDPAAWEDWEQCLQQVVSERQTAEK